MIGEPPSLAGAVQVTVALASPAVGAPIVGAPGTATGAFGVTDVLLAEATLSPCALVAITSKEYAVPLVSPGTSTLVTPAPAGVVVADGVVPVPWYVRTL